MRMSPMEAAKRYVDTFFPRCSLAVLGGSGGKDKLHSHSDLDIVIYDESEEWAYRKTVKEFGWTIECFVLTPGGYKDLFDSGIIAGNPTLQRIVAEGRLIRCDETGNRILEEAHADLDAGPMPWSSGEIDRTRYVITECMDDLQERGDWAEAVFVANRLCSHLCEFLLRVNGRWAAEGKHLFRMLAEFDADGARRLRSAMESFYQRGETEPIVAFTMEALLPYGGALSEGYEEYA